jgi:hypothetical protein
MIDERESKQGESLALPSFFFSSIISHNPMQRQGIIIG